MLNRGTLRHWPVLAALLYTLAGVTGIWDTAAAHADRDNAPHTFAAACESAALGDNACSSGHAGCHHVVVGIAVPDGSPAGARAAFPEHASVRPVSLIQIQDHPPPKTV